METLHRSQFSPKKVGISFQKAFRYATLVTALISVTGFAQDTSSNSQPLPTMPERFPDTDFDALITNAVADYKKSQDLQLLSDFARSALQVGDSLQDLKVLGTIKQLMNDATGTRKTELFNLYATCSAASTQATSEETARLKTENTVLRQQLAQIPVATERIDQYVHRGLPENPTSLVVRLTATREDERLSGRSPLTWKKGKGIKFQDPKISTKEETVRFPAQGFVLQSGVSTVLEISGGVDDHRQNREMKVVALYKDNILTLNGQPFGLDEVRSGIIRLESEDGKTIINASVGGLPLDYTPVRSVRSATRPNFGK